MFLNAYIWGSGSTSTPFRRRFNIYKACYRKFKSGSSVTQMDFFRHFSEEGFDAFLEGVRVNNNNESHLT